MVCLARAYYNEPDYAIICQSIAQHNQMQEFLLKNGPFLPVPPHQTIIATQDNQITDEDQQAATARCFGTLLITATAILGVVTAPLSHNYRQQTLFTV